MRDQLLLESSSSRGPDQTIKTFRPLNTNGTMRMHYYINTTGCLEEVNLCARLVCTKTDFLHVLQARTQSGGRGGVTLPPGKKVSLKNVRKRRESSVKISRQNECEHSAQIRQN